MVAMVDQRMALAAAVHQQVWGSLPMVDWKTKKPARKTIAILAGRK